MDFSCSDDDVDTQSVRDSVDDLSEINFDDRNAIEQNNIPETYLNEQYVANSSKSKGVFTNVSQSVKLHKKIELLQYFLEKDMKAVDFKWSLFCAACNSYRFDSTLRPFPSAFIENTVKDIERLRNVVELVPPMNILLQELKQPKHAVPTEVIHLLSWVLIEMNEPDIQYMPKSKHDMVMSLVKCTTTSAPPNLIFKVVYNSTSQSEVNFQELVSTYGSKYAFHGSRLDNFQSIINYGLQISLNKVAVFGPGIYLSSELGVSLTYSSSGSSWGGSEFGGEMSIIALCQLVDHPEVKCRSQNGEQTSRSTAVGSTNGPIPLKYFLVQNSDLVRIRYLLVYTKPPNIQPIPTYFDVIRRNGMLFAVLSYMVLLLAVSLKNSDSFALFLKKIFRKMESKNF